MDISTQTQIDRSWIQTYTGKAFYPLSPNPEDIDIEDIAHSLALQCRFNGHTRTFYSVAQHSALVMYTLMDYFDWPGMITDESIRAINWGLLHDATEAYLCDIPKPLKASPEFEFYKKREADLEAVIAQKFGLGEMPAIVKEADYALFVVEANKLMRPFNHQWEMRECEMVKHVPKFKPLYPMGAKKFFMEAFNNYFEFAF